MRIAVVIALLIAAEASSAQTRAAVARGVMDGVVTDSSLTPVPGATITLFGSRITATTGENGRFRIVELPAGEYVVMARRLGFASASVTLHIDAGDTLRPAFALGRVTPQLDTVRASAAFATTRMGEFEERRARKVGHFITAEEIEKRNPVFLTDMLRSVLSVRVGRDPYQVGTMRSTTGCPFQIFVDGQIFSETGSLWSTPTTKEIAGVEIYSGPATVPLEYKRTNTRCGAILIWTKGGQ